MKIKDIKSGGSRPLDLRSPSVKYATFIDMCVVAGDAVLGILAFGAVLLLMFVTA